MGLDPIGVSHAQDHVEGVLEQVGSYWPVCGEKQKAL